MAQLIQEFRLRVHTKPGGEPHCVDSRLLLLALRHFEVILRTHVDAD